MGNDGPDYSNVAAGGQVNVTHPLHVEQHEDGGEDELNVGGLGGDLADTQDAKAHKTSHQHGGGDEISLEGLDGIPTELFVVAAIYNTVAEQSIPDAEYTIVDFDTKVKDTHNAVTIGAAWKFITPVTGFYQVSAKVLFIPTDTFDESEDAHLSVWVDGVMRRFMAGEYGYMAGAMNRLDLKGSGLVYLSAEENLDFRVYQNTGAALALYHLAMHVYMTIVKYA